MKQYHVTLAKHRARPSSMLTSCPVRTPPVRLPVRAASPWLPLSLTLAAASSSTTFSSSAYVTKEARQTAFGLAKEQVEEANAPVSGNLPSWLRGTVVINGCGDYRGMEHLFDGFAFLTRIHLDGVTGRATASQRFLDTDAYRSFRETGRMKYREFQTPVPADGPVGRVQVVLENIKALMSKGRAFTDNASINLIPLPGNRLLALGETRSAAYIVDPATLATVRQVEYDDDFPGDLTTAHPKVAPDGSIMNFTRSLPLGGYHVYRQDPVTLRRTRIAFIGDRDPVAPCWVHDMAITSSSLVVVETPLFISMASLILGTKRPYAFMDWKPEAGSRVHVIALDGSGVVTHTAPAFFTFHLGNAFERPSGTSSGTEICVDFSVYDDPEIINDLSLDRLKAFPGKDISPGRLRRLVIPLRDAANRPVGPSSLAAPVPLLTDENAYGNFFEFPAINPRFQGKPYRYMYGTAAIRPTNMGNALARHDVEKGSSIVCCIPGSMPGEPIFVPRPDGSAEDDGVLLALKIMPGGRSVLCVYDAADMSGLANVDLPFNVSYRFHGAYVAAKD